MCCPACGPALRLLDAGVTELPGDRSPARPVLARGQVLAIKGLGGYHLAVDAAASQRPRRCAPQAPGDKPFAVHGRGPGRGPARWPRSTDAGRSAAGQRAAGRSCCCQARGRAGRDAVAPGNRSSACMLPYTPLHHLLLREFGRRRMVLTSGNVSRRADRLRPTTTPLDRLAPIADAFLAHDRPIHIRDRRLGGPRRCRGRELLVRRARGLRAGADHRARTRFRRPVLACGAELKNTFCLANEDRALLSQHIGDLENCETLRVVHRGHRALPAPVRHRAPELVAHDLHPEYLSTKYALEPPRGVELTGVSTTTRTSRPAWPTTAPAARSSAWPSTAPATAPTATIWGGEFLLASLAEAERAGHLARVPMPGGATAIRQPWRMAAAYLAAAFPEGLPAGLDILSAQRDRAGAIVTAMAREGVNAPVSSSAGRLFDAVAALLGVRDVINYEGQAAVELEQRASLAEVAGYPARVSGGPELEVSGTDLVRAAATDLLDGVPQPVIAARFHQGVADLIGQACALLRDRSGLGTVALSGGVFQNLLLLGAAVSRLEGLGFRVLTHSRVPPNDGGISLGQAVVAGARDRLTPG